MNQALLSSEKMDWCTPKELFERLDDEFHFTLDAAASDTNAKCKRYYTEDTDGLAQSWAGETVFCNPPYGREIGKWVRKAYQEAQEDVTVVLLIPARTDTSYFHDCILDKAELRFLRGRLRFEDEQGAYKWSAPFPSMVVVYNGKEE